MPLTCACSMACAYTMTCLPPQRCAVWDSSIVVAKYFERWGNRWAGKRCLDLSAGCGLVGAACLFAAGTNLHYKHHLTHHIHLSAHDDCNNLCRHLIVISDVCDLLHQDCTGDMLSNFLYTTVKHVSSTGGRASTFSRDAVLWNT